MTIRVEDADRVRRVSLCRPPVNALGRAEYRALAEAFTVGDGSQAPRLLELGADGRVWCAGQDLDEYGSQRDPAAYLREVTGHVATVVGCPVPVLTRLDGPAVGVGALLVACSDIVIATPRASVALPELKVGLRLGRSLVADFLPPRLAAHALATGAPLDADRLHRAGAIAEVVPESELDSRAAELVAELSTLSDEDLRWIRLGQHAEQRAEAYVAEVSAILGEGLP